MILVVSLSPAWQRTLLFDEFRPGEVNRVRRVIETAAGKGTNTVAHCATLGMGRPGVLHGSMSYLLQTDDGQVMDTHSISAGLDYPGVGPEHSFFKDTGMACYVSVTDEEALEAFERLSKTEGIIPALESAHAVAFALKLVPTLDAKDIVVICLSGRGDKDVNQVAEMLEGKNEQD